MNYSGDPCEQRKGKKGGRPSRPSKFVKSAYQHSGYSVDDDGGGDGSGKFR